MQPTVFERLNTFSASYIKVQKMYFVLILLRCRYTEKPLWKNHHLKLHNWNSFYIWEEQGAEEKWCLSRSRCDFTLVAETLFAALMIFTVICSCIMAVLKRAIRKAWYKMRRGPSLQFNHILASFTYSIHLKIKIFDWNKMQCKQ